jgi:general secretion pathway protein M
LRAWFENLQPRERWILLAGGGIAMLIIAWVLVVQPLRAQSASLQSSVAAKQRLLIDLARLEGGQPPGTPAGSVRGADQTLVVVIDSTAQAHSVRLSRTRPNGPSGVDVTFQAVSFDVLVGWLVELHSTYAVDVESASLASTREQGFVNGQLSLHRL